MDHKALILDFIKQHKIAVLTTVSPKNHPQAAVMEFGETNDLELIFDTSINYRKYANLQSNPKVAVVIGWDDDITVQYEGIAHELSEPELARYKAQYFAKNPDAQRWEHQKDIRYFKIVPTWIRYSDLRVHPWKVIEEEFK